MNPFPSISVLIPTIDETQSLKYVVSTILSLKGVTIEEIFLIVAPHTQRETLRICGDLVNADRNRVRIIHQALPFLGGALRTGIAPARGSHILFMFADGEADPFALPQMAFHAATEPDTIISASRWLNPNSFIGYGRTKYLLNYCFQTLCSLTTRSRLTDFTYGYRLYPSWVLQCGHWTEAGHAFVLESVLAPLRSSIGVLEIPATWTARQEGIRRIRFFGYCRYLITLGRTVLTFKRQDASARELYLDSVHGSLNPQRAR